MMAPPFSSFRTASASPRLSTNQPSPAGFWPYGVSSNVASSIGPPSLLGVLESRQRGQFRERLLRDDPTHRSRTRAHDDRVGDRASRRVPDTLEERARRDPRRG